MLRWTLSTVALCAITLLALNLAYVRRHDLAVIVRLAVSPAPPMATGTGLIADWRWIDGTPVRAPLDARA